MRRITDPVVLHEATRVRGVQPSGTVPPVRSAVLTQIKASVGLVSKRIRSGRRG